jgi:hypothetical protein
MCVYCATRPATTEDHVFARAFFVEGRRGELPKVPACQPCNQVKSGLEHYLATVLPFAGQHAPANLQDMVPRRLANNLRLHRTLATGMSRNWTREAGVYMPTSTLHARHGGPCPDLCYWLDGTNSQNLGPALLDLVQKQKLRPVNRFHWRARGSPIVLCPCRD